MTESKSFDGLDLHIMNEGRLLQVYSIVKEGEYTLGRSETCTFRINNPSLSRSHIALNFSSGQISVRDSSTYGSEIGGKSLTSGLQYKIEKNTYIDLSEGAITLFLDVEKYVHGTQSDNRTSNYSSGVEQAITEVNDVIAELRSKRELLIGRLSDADIVLSSLQVSRRHAMLRLEGESISIEDLDTTNGTFVNGQLISGKVSIKPSDQITIGAVSFVLEAGIVNQQYAIVAKNIEKVYPKGFVGLQKMTIKVPKNEFVALMGPSGCGKSTLLKCLNGANPATAGEIYILGLQLNNENFQKLKRNIGYVPQDDIVHRELSVEKTLYFAAKLRISGDVTDAEIDEKITSVLKSLNLDPATIRGTKVADLSGGQRKRISIAVELLNDPAILFLDEPTSPLDPETIEDFLHCIRGLVRQGQTVIMVTHKPSDLDYVDKVIFLSKGGYHTYFGNKDGVLTYFERSDIIKIYSLMKDDAVGKEWSARLNEGRQAVTDTQTSVPLNSQKNSSRFSQFYWLSMRYLHIKWNDLWNLILLIAQPFIIALLLIFIFKHLQFSVLFMMSISSVWFGVSNASKEIVSELPIYERERMFNLSITNYIFSKVVILSLIAFIQVLIFVSIIHFNFSLSGADVGLWRFWSHVGFMLCLSISATLLGLLLSAIFRSSEKVMTVVPIALIPQIMLAGIIAKMDTELKVFLSYLTLGRWGTEGFAFLQDSGAKSTGHWVDEENTIPAGVMEFSPRLLAIDGHGDPLPTPEIEVTLQPQSAVDQLNFYIDGKHLWDAMPTNIYTVYAAIMLLGVISFVGIYLSLKNKDSRFV